MHVFFVILLSQYVYHSLSLLGCTAERFFRIDRAQENLHYVSDISTEVIYVLDQDPTQRTPEEDGRHGFFNRSGSSGEKVSPVEQTVIKSTSTIYHERLVCRLFGETEFYLPVDDYYDD
jgi:hypothetical protein